MLAMTGQLPGRRRLAYEFKWDGVRALAETRAATGLLRPVRGRDHRRLPELAPPGRAGDDALLDGEVVLLTEDGPPSFTAFAERMHVREPGRRLDWRRAAPVTYMIFDLLRFRGSDLSGRSYQRRRAALDDLELGGPRWTVPPAFPDGPATYQAAEEMAWRA